MKRLASAASLAVAVGLLALPASSGATITVGSDLTHPIDNTIGGPITAVPTVPASQSLSPVNGVIVGGHVKQGAIGWGTVKIRVLQFLAGGLADALRTSTPTNVPAGTGIFPVSAQLAIGKGDRVAIDATGGLNEAVTVGDAYGWRLSSEIEDSDPPIALNPGITDTELLFNVEIEPTNTFSLSAPVIGKKGTATVVATVPNLGSLVAGAVSDKAVVAKKKKKKQPLLTRVTATAADAGPVTLALRVSKSGRKKLREKGKLTVNAKVVYKPTGGASSTQTVVLKLKR